MNIRLLFLCLIIQAASLLSAPKRNLQAALFHLRLKNQLLLEKTKQPQIAPFIVFPQQNTTSGIDTDQACPTKPPKGSHAKSRLRQAIINARIKNNELRDVLANATSKKK